MKEFVENQLMLTTVTCSELENAEAKGCNDLRREVLKIVDNQIKVLKGGINDIKNS